MRKDSGDLITFFGFDNLILESLIVGVTKWIFVTGNVNVTKLFDFIQEGNM